MFSSYMTGPCQFWTNNELHDCKNFIKENPRMFESISSRNLQVPSYQKWRSYAEYIYTFGKDYMLSFGTIQLELVGVEPFIQKADPRFHWVHDAIKVQILRQYKSRRLHIIIRPYQLIATMYHTSLISQLLFLAWWCFLKQTWSGATIIYWCPDGGHRQCIQNCHHNPLWGIQSHPHAFALLNSG